MRCIWSLSRASTIVALLSSVGLGLGVTPARADDTDTDTEFARQLPVEERVLAEMRGGFTFDSGGFHASFAIIREVLLNGQLVLQGRIVITNLDAML